MDFNRTMAIAASGMKAQTSRMQVIAENIANADSLATVPGGEPYRRQVISFQNMLDRELGVQRVEIAGVKKDMGQFGRRYDPSHPAADESGYVLTPNVNTLIEVADNREAARGYEANLMIFESARSMNQRTLELIRKP